LSSISLQSNPALTHYLVLFGLRTRSETFQTQRRLQVVKDQGLSKTAAKKQLKREATHGQHMMIVAVDQACGGFIVAASSTAGSLI
jgi:hypothetical protein